MGKLAKFFNDIKAVYSFIILVGFILYHGVIWGGDQRYMQTTIYDFREITKEVRQLNRDIARYEIQLLSETNAIKITSIKTEIINLKKEIKDLKGE